ncbi:MAG: indoleacetamide hydrolase [Pigmentiphaga sp.]|nr:indoleacetamide hydrolase [Pigmentiphaga sp.]
MDLLELDISAARAGLLRRDFSCEEYVGALVDQAQRHEDLHAWSSFDPDALRAAARQEDAAGRATDASLPLAGVPLAVKDNIDVAGMLCTAGTGAFRDRMPARDAGVVAALREAGGLMAGKTILHELAMGITSNNAVTGAARNPYDPARSAGGSSGGSATAVAARMVPAALGTDTGGSVRVPAAFCGLVGLRPTTGRYRGDGCVPLARTRDTAGPMTRSVRDAALLDALITRDDTLPTIDLSGLRLGVPASFSQNVDPEIAAAFEAVLQRLSRAGAHIVQADMAGRDELNGQIGFPIVLYELERDLPPFLAAEGRELSLAQLHAGIGSPDVAAIVAQQLGDEAVTTDEYQRALQLRSRLQGMYAEHYRQHRLDAAIFPTCPLPAPLLGLDVTVPFNGMESPTFLTYIRHTDPGSVAGVPGLGLPMGLVRGLPIGLALEGPPHSDRFLLALGERIAADLPPTPPPFPARAGS